MSNTIINYADVQGTVLRGYRVDLARHFVLSVADPARARAFIAHLPAARKMTPAKVRDAGFRLADAQSVVARSNGFEGNIDQFAALTAEEQLPFVLNFIKRMPTSCLHLPGDFGLALFTPAYVCKPDDFVIYAVGSAGWEQNPGLRTAGGGPITAGKVRSTAR